MGCTGSKGKDAGVAENTKPEVDLRPDALRKEINEVYKAYLEKKDQLKPLISEKVGLQTMLDEQREKLIGLLGRKDGLLKDREPLLQVTWERDVEEIYKSFGKFSLDKGSLIDVVINRTTWQLRIISDLFERKYGSKLLEFVVNEMTTVLGKLATGSTTGLCKLLTFRLMDQGERDAAFVKDYTDGLGLDNEGLLEIICTRSNAQLKCLIEAYQRDYKKSLVEHLRNKCSYSNHRDFILNILECNHDETNKPFPPEVAHRLAQELYDAGEGKTFSADVQPFIQILGNISNIQFESINEQYPGNKLLKVINDKFGGDFRTALLTRVSDKYEFLANRMDKVLKSFSLDKDSICRILGSLSHPECVKFREAFDRMNLGRTLEEAFKAVIHKGNFQKACLDLINPEISNFPLGSLRENEDDEQEASREGDLARKLAEDRYQKNKVIQLGEQTITAKSKRRVLAASPAQPASNSDSAMADGDAGTIDANSNVSFRDDMNPDNSASSAPINTASINLILEEMQDDIPSYNWDFMRGRFMDTNRLTKELKDCQEASKVVSHLKERLADEIVATRDIYFSIVKHCSETEAWIRIYTNQNRALKDFVDRRNASSTKRPRLPNLLK